MNKLESPEENFHELDNTNRKMIISFVKRIITKNFFPNLKPDLDRSLKSGLVLYDAIADDAPPKEQNLQQAYKAAKILFKARSLDELPFLCEQLGLSYLSKTEQQGAKQACIGRHG